MSKTQTYKPVRWSLNDLFASPTDPKLEKAFKTVEKSIKALEAQRPKLTEKISSADFMAFIKDMEKAEKIEMHLHGYATLLFEADTQSQAAQTLLARVEQFVADMANRILFFSLWWKDLSEKNAQRLMKDAGDYRYFLAQIRLFKPHTLSEPEEKILNLKAVTGFQALNTLYSAITNRYVFKLKVDGKEKEMTRGELMMHVRGPNAALREAAYKELYRVYSADGPILGQMYQTLARDWRNENITLRSYKTPIALRNLTNDIPDKVVDTLLDVAVKNSGVFQRYFKLKARHLGVKKLRRYDLYAPLSKSDKKYAYDKATAMVFESFNHFDAEFAGLAESLFKESHVDSEVRKGKRDGAFCLTVEPGLKPWVLLNYQGKADDVFTMAHELGHGIHSMLASHHTMYTQHACLPLAETASTFAEMLMVDKMLKEEPDEAVRRDILFSQVDDNYATIQRQIFFALFEREAHDMIAKNASVDDLCAAYMKNLKTQFGDSMDISDEFKWEWVCIPHIYNVPFYVYAYAFGQLLVLSLYKQFQKEGEAFKPRYRKILATGGSQAPVELLKDAGVDVTKAAFWQGGYDVLDEMIKRLEALPVKK